MVMVSGLAVNIFTYFSDSCEFTPELAGGMIAHLQSCASRHPDIPSGIATNGLFRGPLMYIARITETRQTSNHVRPLLA